MFIFGHITSLSLSGTLVVCWHCYSQVHKYSHNLYLYQTCTYFISAAAAPFPKTELPGASSADGRRAVVSGIPWSCDISLVGIQRSRVWLNADSGTVQIWYGLQSSIYNWWQLMIMSNFLDLYHTVSGRSCFNTKILQSDQAGTFTNVVHKNYMTSHVISNYKANNTGRLMSCCGPTRGMPQFQLTIIYIL